MEVTLSLAEDVENATLDRKSVTDGSSLDAVRVD